MQAADENFGPADDDLVKGEADHDADIKYTQNCTQTVDDCESDESGTNSGESGNPATGQSAAQTAAQVPDVVKQEINASVNDSNGKTSDDTHGGHHEEGGEWDIGDDPNDVDVIRWKAGPSGDPGSGATVKPGPGFPHHGYAGNWHVHPRGTALNMNGEMVGFEQSPSIGPGMDTDRVKGLKGINIVVGAGDKTVYFYNSSQGITGQMSLNAFMKVKYKPQ
jgi:hypothetical protein